MRVLFLSEAPFMGEPPPSHQSPFYTSELPHHIGGPQWQSTPITIVSPHHLWFAPSQSPHYNAPTSPEEADCPPQNARGGPPWRLPWISIKCYHGEGQPAANTVAMNDAMWPNLGHYWLLWFWQMTWSKENWVLCCCTSRGTQTAPQRRNTDVDISFILINYTLSYYIDFKN